MIFPYLHWRKINQTKGGGQQKFSAGHSFIKTAISFLRVVQSRDYRFALQVLEWESQRGILRVWPTPSLSQRFLLNNGRSTDSMKTIPQQTLGNIGCDTVFHQYRQRTSTVGGERAARRGKLGKTEI